MPEPRLPKKTRHKPTKPNASFPLTAHNNGRWCKKIRGKIHFFGVWEEPQAALDSYLRVAADLHAGRQPRQPTLAEDGPTVKEVCNQYLTYQLHKVRNGGIRPATFEDCRSAVVKFAKVIGPTRAVTDLGPADFEQFRHRILRRGSAGRPKGLGVCVACYDLRAEGK